MGDQSVNLLSCDIFTSYAGKVEMPMNTDYKFKKSNGDSQETIVIASMSPAMQGVVYLQTLRQNN